MADDLVRAGELSAELASLLPSLQSALAAKLQEVEAAEARANAAAASLAEREAALAAREAKCAAMEAQQEQAAEALKKREQELANRKPAAGTRKQNGMDSLSMQILARATATALLKHQLSSPTPAV